MKKQAKDTAVLVIIGVAIVTAIAFILTWMVEA